MNLPVPQALRVLIIDDENIVRAHLRMLLNDLQIQEVMEAESGMDALEILLDVNRPFPDLIITDMLMAEMDGIEFCNTVRRSEMLRNVGVPIIVLTSAKDPFLHGVSKQVGALHVVNKPITSEKLSNLIEIVIRSVPVEAL